MIPYGKQSIDEEDIQAVAEVLSSGWLTTGPKVAEFERIFADFVGSKEAVAVCNGTAALHAAMFSLEIGPGDEVIVPPMTFASTANCILFQGGTPVFADIDPDTLLIDPTQVEAKITSRTRAIIAVDYTGQPCEYDELQTIANEHGLALIADACHSLGGKYKARPVGSLADLSVFSFHPVKHITTGEGGMVTTDDSHLAERMRIFRNHGITSDHHQRTAKGSWYYEMVALGYNYRLTDFQCALGMAQLTKLPAWLGRRREIATRYAEGFASMPEIELPVVQPGREHAWHLYVIRLNLECLRVGREEIFRRLRGVNIGVNVHYIPVHLHPFYRNRFSTGPGMCPVAEATYERLLSLPLFHGMTDDEVDTVIQSVSDVIRTYAV